jgi:hypothetical protein
MSSVANSPGVPDPTRLADPVRPTRGPPAPGDEEAVTGPATNEPIAGYDGLTTRDLIGSLSSHSEAELTAIESYERAHRKRKAVIGKLRVLRDGDRRVREHKALTTDQVVAALRRFRARSAAPVAGDTKR